MHHAADMDSFGVTLRKLREAQDLTIPELATASRLSPRYISYLESDEKVPTLTTVKQLAEALGIQAGAELVQAAFPDLRILTPRSRKSATARERSYAILGMLSESDDLALSAAGG